MNAVAQNTETTNTVVVPDPAVVAEARRQGWVPEDQYKGSAKWLPPEEFVAKGKELNPILRQRLSAAEGEIKELRRDLAQTNEDAKSFKETARRLAESEWKEKYDTLKAQLARAVTDGDGERAADLTEQLDEHREAKPAVPKKPNGEDTTAKPPELPQWAKDWYAANQWYENPRARAIANGIGATKVADGLSGVELMEAVRAEMEERYPELVGLDTRGPIVNIPGRRTPPTTTKGRTYNDLPDDAKAACDRQVAKGWLKQEEYLAAYQWD